MTDITEARVDAGARAIYAKYAKIYGHERVIWDDLFSYTQWGWIQIARAALEADAAYLATKEKKYSGYRLGVTTLKEIT